MESMPVSNCGASIKKWGIQNKYYAVIKCKKITYMYRKKLMKEFEREQEVGGKNEEDMMQQYFDIKIKNIKIRNTGLCIETGRLGLVLNDLITLTINKC